ncbi:MAG: M20/M25/M40 family metallo-hydrolase [Verrucomicrobia subdivision 3 bacterium]|nr:M20/M25/M40 family metallo-hydrolase [Limisphaerales bacterium]
MGQVDQLLEELIALPSVNPAFLPPGDRLAGEQRVADYLASVAKKLGLPSEHAPVCPGRTNLLIRLTPTHTRRLRILLAPHLDTVGGSNLPGNLFTPRRKNARIYGRGACDTKGSVAAMFSALCAIARDNPPQETEIIFGGLADEESGQAGSRRLATNGFRADLAIVGEPTQLKIVTAHKGVVWLRLTTSGKAAHGARPELGRNAVHAMAQIVDLLETKYAAQLRRHKHPLLGRGTINVGAIQGGSQPNIVPSSCSIMIDRRTLPGERETEVCREIRQLLKSRNLSAKVESLQGGPCWSLDTDPAQPLVANFLSIAGQRKLAGVDYFSDAAILAAGGIPSVLFGPGDIAQAHTPDEWIAVDSLERAERLLIRFFRSLP